MELEKDAVAPENERIPQFGIGAGIFGIFVYLLGSIPALIAIQLYAMSEHQQELKTNPQAELADVLKDIFENPWTSVIALISQCIAFLIFVWLISRFRGTRSVRNDFGLRFRTKALWYFFLGVGLQIGGIILSIPFIVLKNDDLPEQQIVRSVKESGGAGVVVLMVMVALIVPIVEEICFRGLFQRGLSKKFAPALVVIISGFIFAGVHLADPNALLGITQLLIVGVACAALAQYSGRIDSAIMTHIGFNTTTVLLLLLAS